MRVALVGCGLIGGKRLAALKPNDSVVTVTDTDRTRAEQFATKYGAAVAIDALAACTHPDVDAVIISVTHDTLASLTQAAVQAGKHVLVEKPGARRPEELDPAIAAAKARRLVVKVGFNHRFHPALRRAHEIVVSGELGPIMFIRGRYGHGGRKGYEREWRFQKDISGGGELLDQGSHLIDLSRWFMGDFAQAWGRAPRYFWQGQVDDNAFLALETTQGQMAWLSAGWTEWKNIFAFEIMGRAGKLQIDGLGGSYGVEKLTYYRMLSEMGPPETTSWEYPFPDKSWNLEWDAFLDSVAGRAASGATLADARAVLQVVADIYKGQA